MAEPRHLTLAEKKALVIAVRADLDQSLRAHVPRHACACCVARALTVALLEDLAIQLAVTYEGPSDLADIAALLERSVLAVRQLAAAPTTEVH